MDLLRIRQNQRTREKPRPRRGRWLGYLLAVLSRPWQGHHPPVTSADLKRHDHPASTQRLGLRFTERIRNTFRHRWLRKLS